MDRETAVEFTQRIETAFALMAEVGGSLKARLDQVDFANFMETWGRIIMELDLGVLEVIYRAHPDLRPEGMIPVSPLGAGCGWSGSRRDDDGCGSDKNQKSSTQGPPGKD